METVRAKRGIANRCKMYLMNTRNVEPARPKSPQLVLQMYESLQMINWRFMMMAYYSRISLQKRIPTRDMPKFIVNHQAESKIS